MTLECPKNPVFKPQCDNLRVKICQGVLTK